MKNNSGCKASLIISIYKNCVFLKAVLDSLPFQTEQNFEIIISEDGNDPEVKRFIDNYPFQNPHKHLVQEDLGWRKNRALNRAILAASAEQLIFIDGDCILHPRFIEIHTTYFQQDRILAGLRVFLNEEQSTQVLKSTQHIQKIQFIIWKALIKSDGIKRPEEGIFCSPTGFMAFIPKLRKLDYLTGCNMSFSKIAIMSINGFDEDYDKPAYGEDTDLVWRFKMAGYKFYSLRNLAVQYHLNHPRSWTDQSENMNKGMTKQQRKEYICKLGIALHLQRQK